MLNGLPEKIVRHPELFVVNGGSPEEAKIEKTALQHKSCFAKRGYTRQDNRKIGCRVDVIIGVKNVVK